VWAHLVEVAPPALDQNRCFGARPEPFERQALVAELAVEALGGAVLPGLAGIDEGRLNALVNDPLQQCARDEPGAIVGPKVARRATLGD
jgi:hypothetical protein